MALPFRVGPDDPGRSGAADPFLEFESEAGPRPQASSPALDVLLRRVPAPADAPSRTPVLANPVAAQPEEPIDPLPSGHEFEPFLSRSGPPAAPRRSPINPTVGFALGIAGLVMAAVAYYQLAQNLASGRSASPATASVATLPLATAPLIEATPAPSAPPGPVRRPGPAAAAAAKPAVSGWVMVDAPIELSVFEGGRLRGTTRDGRLSLPVGARALELVNDSLEVRQAASVTVAGNEVTRIAFAMPTGSLSVNALPWAEVWVAGRKLGTTPLANVTVPVGSHEILWRHPTLGDRRQTVTVKAKTPVRLGVDMHKQP